MNHPADTSPFTGLQHPDGTRDRHTAQLALVDHSRPARRSGADRGQLTTGTDSRSMHHEIGPDQQFLPVTRTCDVGHDNARTTADVDRDNVVTAPAELVHNRVPDESAGTGHHRTSHVRPSRPSAAPGPVTVGRPCRHAPLTRLAYRPAAPTGRSLRSHHIDPT